MNHVAMSWEAEIVCEACETTHVLNAELKPRTFAYECPSTGDRVDMRFRDPSRTSAWVEVESASEAAVGVIDAQTQGTLEI